MESLTIDTLSIILSYVEDELLFILYYSSLSIKEVTSSSLWWKLRTENLTQLHLPDTNKVDWRRAHRFLLGNDNLRLVGIGMEQLVSFVLVIIVSMDGSTPSLNVKTTNVIRDHLVGILMADQKKYEATHKHTALDDLIYRERRHVTHAVFNSTIGLKTWDMDVVALGFLYDQHPVLSSVLVQILQVICPTQ